MANKPLTDNATFITFKESGKYYTSARYFLDKNVFEVFSKEERLRLILASNDGQFPGLSGAGHDFVRVVIIDDAVDYGYPLMFPINTGVLL